MEPKELLPIALAVTVAASLFVSCHKTDDKNPPVVEVAAAPFTLTAVESRNGHDYPWTISRTGVTDSMEEDIDEMYVTAFNSVVVTVTPDEPGAFPGFNVRSSDTDAVTVKNIGANSFELKRAYKYPYAEATIEVWNGSGSTERKIAFKVKSQQMIEATAFIFEVDGKRIDVPLYDNYQDGDKNAVTILTIPESEKDPNTDVIHKIVCAGFEPQNASVNYADIGPLIINQEWIDWLKEHGKDFTFIRKGPYGYEGPMSELWEHNTMYTCLRLFGVVSHQFETPIRIVISRDGSAPKYGSAYIYLPFSSLDDEWEWVEKNW